MSEPLSTEEFARQIADHIVQRLRETPGLRLTVPYTLSPMIDRPFSCVGFWAPGYQYSPEDRKRFGIGG